MAKSSGGGWLIKGLGCMGLLAVLCCCGGIITVRFFPDFLLGYVLADTPLPGPTTEAKPVIGALEQGATCLLLATTGEAPVSPEAVARWLAEDAEADLTVLRVNASGDEAALDLSVATDDSPPRYFNLQLQGSFTMTKGWFTDLRVSRLIVRDHDWSSYMIGQQLTQQGNQSLANERAKNPDLAELLDGVNKLTVQDGSFVIGLERDSMAMQRLCGER